MSALGLDDVNDPRGVLAYAPRKSRRDDDESTIRPILERLSRSEGRVPGPRLVRKADVQDVAQPQVETVARSAFPMTARLAVAAGVLALVGAAAAGYLTPPSAAEHAAQSATTGSAPAALPKPVQTVSIQRPADADTQGSARLIKDDARMPQVGASTDAALPAPLRPASNDPSITPLAAWAAVPVQGPGWSTPAVQPAAIEARAAADDSTPSGPAAKPEAKEPAHKTAKVHHARQAVHHRATHQRRHRTAQAASRQAGQSAQADATQAAQAQPVKKLPLQAAIDRIFGGGAAAPAQPPQQ